MSVANSIQKHLAVFVPRAFSWLPTRLTMWWHAQRRGRCSVVLFNPEATKGGDDEDTFFRPGLLIVRERFTGAPILTLMYRWPHQPPEEFVNAAVEAALKRDGLPPDALISRVNHPLDTFVYDVRRPS